MHPPKKKRNKIKLNKRDKKSCQKFMLCYEVGLNRGFCTCRKVKWSYVQKHLGAISPHLYSFPSPPPPHQSWLWACCEVCLGHIGLWECYNVFLLAMAAIHDYRTTSTLGSLHRFVTLLYKH